MKLLRPFLAGVSTRRRAVGFGSIILAALVGALGVRPALAEFTSPSPWQADLLGEAPAPSAVRALWLTGAELDLALAQEDASELPDLGEGNAAPRRWWPMLASIALPGLGETLTGHRRGWFMMAADVGVWYGIADRQQEGDDWEDRYEAFALEHWSEDDWARALDEGRLTGLYPELGPGSTPSSVALYVSRELDEREWFENLGKWDVFAWGWREFHDDVWNGENHPDFLGAEVYNPLPGDPSTWFFPSDRPTMTPLRQQYVDMRVKSNDAFDTRDDLFNVAVLLRVFSALQVAYLEGFIGNRFDATHARSTPPPAGIRADWVIAPLGSEGALVGWKVVY